MIYPAASVLTLALAATVPFATDTTGDPVTVLVNYGGLVGAFALVILGRLHTSGEITALTNQIAALTKQVDERDDVITAKDGLIAALTQAVTQRAIPAMTEQSRVLEAIPAAESALVSLLRESLAKTEELTTRLGAKTEESQ